MNWRVLVSIHAAERAATAVHSEMGRGLFGLATVASTAPFLGILLNVIGIVGSFTGVCGEKTAIMAALAGRFSESIVPTACGVAIAVTALTGHRLFTTQLSGIDAEMRAAILQLTNDLSRFRQ
jgi:biopolymer transport protein ExbB/biopolymer transport protein TolQ